MNPEMIELIIKWGPLAIVGVTFLVCFVIGLIRGTYKVTRRLIYVLLYVVLVYIFIDNITGFVLDFNIPVDGFGTVRGFIKEFIESNEEVNKFLGYSPDLKALFVDSPEIIVSPILFIVLVLVGLPLSFPIYWLYLLIFHLIMKYGFKREKYEKDENGKILRNEKGKKVKVKRPKRRLVGGLIRGVQGVVLICISLLPVNFVNRLYNKAKDSADLDEGETLCGSFAVVDIDEQICKYIDVYNETIFAKISGENSFDKKVFDHLTSVEVGEEKIELEHELSSLVVSVVLLNDSGLLDLLMQGEIDLETLDLSVINFDKLDLMIDSLFSSYTVSKLTEAGVGYVLNEVLKDNLVEVLKDDDIVSKLEYENSEQIERELKDVVSVLKHAIDKNIDNLIIDNTDNVINMVNGVNENDLKTLLNKLLSLRIINKAMPSVIRAYAEEFGVNAPSDMTSELNSEVADTFVQAVKFVKTLELTSLEDLTEGDVVANLSNALFVEGAIKENSKDGLATLLHDLNSSYLFKNVLSTQLNNLLKDKDYKVDARVIKYVTTKDEWNKELDVLETAFKLYNDYNESEIVNYDNVTGLLNDLSGTKVLLSILPFAYDELLPEVGIEIDSEGFPVIDFDSENEDASKQEFYNTWNAELLRLKDIADAVEVLQLENFEEIDVALFEEEENVDAFATVMSKVYESSMLKEPFVDYMKDVINEFVVDFEVEFTKEELLSIDTKDKWENEFSNISDVLSVDFSDENSVNGDNLSTVFNAVGSMELFKTKKIDILKYAIRESNFLTVEEYESIAWPNKDNQAEVDAFWNNETSVLVDIVDEKDTIESLTTDVDLKTLNTEEIGDLLNRAMESSILNSIVTNKVSELFVSNGVRDDRDEGESTVNLKNSISTVSDWKVELASIKEMLNISEDNMSDVATGEVKNTVEKMFDRIETSELLKNTRANLLLKSVEMIDITDVPTDVTVDVLKSNNYQKYNNERDIIVHVSKNKNTFDELATMDLDSIDTVKVGGLLNVVTSSIIFKDYVVGEIKTVFVSNDVRDDRDIGESTVNLENSIAGVSDWASELTSIKEMLSISEDNMSDVAAGESKNAIEKMFDRIETSELLKNTRANLLLKAVKIINITEVPNAVTVDVLRADNYLKYNNEKNVIIEVSKNKDTFDEFATMDLDSIDTGEVGNLLDTVTSSIIFKDYVVGEIKTVFVSSGVKDDRDEGESTVNLENSIASVSSWANELGIIKNMLNMTGDNFDSKSNGKTNVEIMFDNIENSELLKNTRANLLIKAITTINLEGVSVPTSVTVATLMADNYAQYDNETNVFVTFAENIDAIDGLTDITSLTGDSKTAMAAVLDAMKVSKILETKYVSTLDTALSTVRSNEDLVNYGVTFKTKEQTNSYKDIVWSTEINSLTTISDNINSVSKYDDTSIDTPEERIATVAVIGSTLDAVSASTFLGESQSDLIADKVIDALTNGVIRNITKNPTKTWTEAFNDALAMLP